MLKWYHYNHNRDDDDNNIHYELTVAVTHSIPSSHMADENGMNNPDIPVSGGGNCSKINIIMASVSMSNNN